jgi:hypothetical protein
MHRKAIVTLIAVLLVAAVTTASAFALLPRPGHGVYENQNGYFFDATSGDPEPMGDDTVVGYVVDTDGSGHDDNVIFYFQPMEYKGLIGSVASIQINGVEYYNSLVGQTDYGYAVFPYPGVGNSIHIDEIDIAVAGYPHIPVLDVDLVVEN